MENEEASSLWTELRDEGNKAFKGARYDDAVEFYSKAISANPKISALFSNRSAAYLKQGKFESAVQDAETAIAIDNAFAKAYSRLHNALCNLGRFSEAVQKLKNGVQVLEKASTPKEDVKHLIELQADAENARKSVENGRRLLESNDLLAAERVLMPIARAFPDCIAVLILLSKARASREPDEVMRALMRFSHSHSEDSTYLYTLALSNYYRGPDGFKSAQVLLRKVLEMDPDNTTAALLLRKVRSIEAHKEKGNTAFREKRCRDAIEEYTSALELDPSNIRMVSTLRGNQAAAKMELKDYSSALLDCDFAINNGASNAKMYARRGRIHEALESYDDALRDLQHAAEQDASFEKELQHLKARARKAKRKDYYKILGLSQNESDSGTIKAAYKKGCLQWHPDKWAHASEEEKQRAEKMFKEVGEAFSILSDPQKKRMYDNGQLDNAVEGASNGASGFGGSNEDVMNMMNMMFGGGGGAGGFPGGPFGFSGVQHGGRRSQQGFSFSFF